jgi:carbonic anhydrase
MSNISGKEALQLLKEGNKRFTTGNLAVKNTGGTRREDLLNKGQKPFAVIVTCSDSRVPPELIFDQALGDLFVIRTAGNVVDQIAVGSAEYGVEHLEVPLLVVMGHEKCGAVQATVDGGEAPGSIAAIVSKIAPSAQKARAAGASGNDLYEKCCLENIKATIDEIKESHIIKHLMKDGKLKIAGAKYHLGSGVAEFVTE